MRKTPKFQPSEDSLEEAFKANEAYSAAKSAEETIGHLATNLSSIDDKKVEVARTATAALVEFKKDREDHFRFRLQHAGERLSGDKDGYEMGLKILAKIEGIEESKYTDTVRAMVDAFFMNKNKELSDKSYKRFRGELEEDTNLTPEEVDILTLVRSSGYNPIVATEMAVNRAIANESHGNEQLTLKV